MMDTERNNGLDIVRSMAILMVLVSHSTFFFSHSPLGAALWRLEIFGYYGVELFFVLSGFLIGRILLRTFLTEQPSHSWRSLLWNFYLRRWFRTLPLYYLMLAANAFIWSHTDFGGIPFTRQVDWRHFVFLQNYSSVAVGFFPESWSLAVEEWFYLVFPLLIIWQAKQAKPGSRERNMGYWLPLFIIGILLIRGAYVYLGQPVFDFGIRKNIFLRMDALAFGVWAAYLAEHKPARLQWYSGRSRQLLAVTLLSAVTVLFWQMNWEGWDRSFSAYYHARYSIS
jgi:peptidoglycan/LPS O-acetylase OafA/YrhL